MDPTLLSTLVPFDTQYTDQFRSSDTLSAPSFAPDPLSPSWQSLDITQADLDAMYMVQQWATNQSSSAPLQYPYGNANGCDVPYQPADQYYGNYGNAQPATQPYIASYEPHGYYGPPPADMPYAYADTGLAVTSATPSSYGYQPSGYYTEHDDVYTNPWTTFQAANPSAPCTPGKFSSFTYRSGRTN
jgi:hypothetical protein